MVIRGRFFTQHGNKVVLRIMFSYLGAGGWHVFFKYSTNTSRRTQCSSSAANNTETERHAETQRQFPRFVSAPPEGPTRCIKCSREL